MSLIGVPRFRKRLRRVTSDAPPSAWRRVPHSSRGFSLVEIMVASAVLSVCLLGLAQMLATAVQLGQFARNNTVAIQIATGKLSELKAAYHYELASRNELPDLAPGEHGPNPVTLPAPTGAQEAASYTVSWVVTGAGASRKNVTVSVRPRGGSGAEADTSLTGKAISMYARFTP